ncbi:WD40 repeat domain-containing protein [Moorena producens]|uniref:WD40 repeat domain-containing protein n=1 Tax=Moorena producens TaxID=1155739 RepID=UPI003C76E4D2
MSNLRSWLAQKSPEEIEHFLGEIPRLWLEGGNLNKLSRLLSNYEFIEAKLNHPEFGIKALIEDYELIDDIDLSHPDYSEQTITSLKLIQGALRLSTHILSQDPNQLAGQLSGRLLDSDTPDIQRLLQQIPQTNTTCLRSLTATLSPPTGPLLSTLIGHDDSVNAVAVTPDGTRVISGSSDNTVKVWNLNTGAEIRTLTGHSAPVNTVAVTPDGSRVISGASDNTVRVWNLATGKEILRFNGHSHPVVAVAVTPDGKKVVSEESIANSGAIMVDSDSIKVWNLETGQEELILEGHRDILRNLGIPFNNDVIYDSDDGSFNVYSSKTGKFIDKLYAYKNSDIKNKLYAITGEVLSNLDPYSSETKEDLYAIAVTPDCKSLIALYSDNFLKVSDLETNQESCQVKFHFQLQGHTDQIINIAFTPDGKRFISASKDKTLKVWNFGLLENNNQVINDNNSVNDVTITPDGKQAIFALPYNIVRVYNLEKIAQNFKFATDKYQYRFSRIQNRFVEIIDNFFDWWIKALAINLCYSLLSLGITLFLIVKDKFYPRIRLNDYFHLLLFVSPVIIGFLFNILFLVKLLASLIIGNENNKNQFQQAPKMHSNLKLDESSESLEKKEIITLGIIPYKNELICVDKHLNLWNSCYFLTFWDLNKKNHNYDLRTTSQLIFIALGLLIPITSISLSVFYWETIVEYLLPLRPWLSTILIWCGLSVTPLVVSGLALVFYESLTTLSITPDGNYVIAGSINSTIKVWHLETKKLRFVLKGHDNEITSLAITPDGKYLVSGSKDKSIKLWNLETRKECFTLIGHRDSVKTLAVTPDGKYVVSGSKDNTIKIWDLENREEIFTFTGHSDSINRIKITSNGKLVISASSDKTLQVWDFETREVIATFTGESAINCCAVAPDDVTIVAGDEAGNMHFLRLEGVGSRE